MSYILTAMVSIVIGFELGWQLRRKLEPWMGATLHITSEVH